MERPQTFRIFAAKMLFGAAISVALAGCEDTAENQAVPAFAQTCTALADAQGKPLRTNFEAPYFGCANDANLRAMVDNPEDLERGRALGPANGERESAGVDTYRSGKNKPFEPSSPPIPSIIMNGGSGGSQ